MNRDGIPLEEAARNMMLTAATLRRALEQGLVHGRRAGDGWRVDPHEVTAFERNPERRLKLPLTADDILCARCGKLPADCNCD